jgi:hypothetical protein
MNEENVCSAEKNTGTRIVGELERETPPEVI